MIARCWCVTPESDWGFCMDGTFLLGNAHVTIILHEVQPSIKRDASFQKLRAK